MLVVKVELHSAVTGEVTTIGRMTISNDATGSKTRGNYITRVFRRDSDVIMRTGEVKNFPRKSYNLWRLVSRCLRTAFPEENRWTPAPTSKPQKTRSTKR